MGLVGHVSAVLSRACIVAALALWLGPIDAEAVAPSPEFKCRDAVAKSTRKAASGLVNARAKCLKQRLRFRLGASVDCLADPAALGGPGSGDAATDTQVAKILKRRDGAKKTLASRCKNIDLAATGLADICAAPATTTDELAECAIMDLAKPGGDALAEIINIPQPAVSPPGGARKCYEVINRAIRFNERKLNSIRGDCFKRTEQSGGSNAACLATAAPPGIVNPTGNVSVDEDLVKRLTSMRGNIFRFCEGVDFGSLGFDTHLPDPTGGTFTLDDAFGELYDALLDEVTVINAAIWPTVNYCGNSSLDAGEQCDDGNRVSCDGCDRDCSLPVCQNGAACAPELCDDGNPDPGDGCDGSCIDEVCGNGVIQGANGEVCDDGVGNSDLLPDACRSDCQPAGCGDGVIDTGETCDPPNGITCDSNCLSPGCGNGFLDPGEQCDDGPGNSDVVPDACRTTCMLPTCGDGVTDSGEQCDPPDGSLCDVDCSFLDCGNGVIDPGEDCDDGAGNNDTIPDACRTDCTDPACGDGVTDTSETCDDGGESATCDDDCTAVVCPDGNTNAAAGEQCDDNNGVDGDGCDSNCTTTGCGNSIVTAGEFCDDGGNSPTCDADCTAAACGDGFTNGAAGETCDDSGESATCDDDCTAVVCPDSNVNEAAGEECDDGNLTPGDGCNASCLCGPGSGEVGCGPADPLCPSIGEATIYAATGITACANNGDCAVGTCDTGLGLCTTTTALHTGWTGIAHGADVNDQVTQRAVLHCPGPFDGGLSEPCGQCQILGLRADTRDCRCAGDNRAVCDEPLQNDADDCGGGLCECYLGGPLPLSAGNTPACSLNKFSQDISGSTNVDLGEGQVTANLAAVVYLGINLILPCPACGGTCTAPAGSVGDGCAVHFNCDSAPAAGDGVCGNYDTLAKDGVRDGTCLGGLNDGQACDVDSYNSSFPAPGPSLAGMSLDCFPDPGKNVSGTGLKISLTQTTGVTSLPPASITCGFPPFVTYDCPCGQCTNDTSIPCTSDAVCSGGTCVADGSGAPLPDQCASTGNCVDLGGGQGECGVGPVDNLCDGIVRASGEGFISCLADIDCEPGTIGIDAGACTLVRTRPCMLDPVSSSGTPDPSAPIAAATFCIAKTSNGGINTVAGLPGPATVRNQAGTKTFCGSDTNVQYTPGVGGCP
jgi:cysteine-rich repeat protein